jgi:hypothetical protein
MIKIATPVKIPTAKIFRATDPEDESVPFTSPSPTT